VNYRHFLKDVDAAYADGLHSGTIREDGESEITLGRQSRLDPLRDQLELLKIRPGTDVGGPDRTPSSVVATIAKHCQTRNIRLTEFFKDGDPLRHGIINQHKFRTGLASAGVRVSDHEFKHLAARFDAGHKAKDGAGLPFVAWKKFLNEVNEINEKNAAAQEEGDIQYIFAISSPNSPQSMDYADEELIARSLAEIANACVVRRLDLRQSFQDFDKQNRGYVSSSVFDRVLALIGVRPADPSQMRGLISKFAEQTPDSRVDVNYKAFAAAIANIMKGLQEPEEVLNTSQYRINTATSKAGRGNMAEYDNRTYVGPPVESVPKRNGAVEAVLLDIVAQLKTKNGRLLDFFKDGDRLGGGELSHFKFRSALGRAGLLVDNDMFAEIASEFASKKRRGEMIDWRKFHEALNDTRSEMAEADATRKQATSQDVENYFQASCYTPKTNPSTGGTGGLGDFGDVDEMESLLDAIAQVTTTKRLLMKPFFQDLDRCNANQVSKAQMGSVLSQNVGLDLTAQELGMLFNAFCVYDVKGQPTDRFDYKKFIKRVDSVEIH
jgi:Ca2+-binding EF-hand superfamily protein